jgi:hypothetical protein
VNGRTQGTNIHDRSTTMNGTTNTNERLVVEVELRTQRAEKGARIFVEGPEPENLPAGRVPRVSKLMALALSIESRVRAGELESYAHVAELGHVTRARITQITNLVNLAPDIIEELLFLPRIETGRDLFLLRDLQPIAQELDWSKQRKLWRELVQRVGGESLS